MYTIKKWQYTKEKGIFFEYLEYLTEDVAEAYAYTAILNSGRIGTDSVYYQMVQFEEKRTLLR